MKIKIILSSLKTLLINIAIICVLLEIMLRIFPAIIPPKLLVLFEPELRGSIAHGRFPTANQALVFKRYDDGFPFKIWKPNAIITYSYNDPGIVNTVHMDEMGFCNLPRNYHKTATIDLITIGDSFTWCTSVAPEDTWTTNFAKIAGLSSYNLGKSGIGLYEYIQIFQKFGIQKSPRFVVMNVYEGNDLRDAIRYHTYREIIKKTGKQPDLYPNPFLHTLYQGLKAFPLRDYSYAYNFTLASMLYSYSKISSSQSARDEENFRYNIVFENSSIPFNLENTDTDEIIYAKSLVDKKIDLDVFTEALKIFVELSKKYNFIPIVTYTPSAHTSYVKNVIFEDNNINNILQAFSEKQRHYFQIKGKELGYMFIDFTQALQVAAPTHNTPEKLLYYQTNLHLTKYGHKIIADALSQSLQTLNKHLE